MFSFSHSLPHVSSKEAYDQIEEKGNILIDVREKEELVFGYPKGSTSCPLSRFSEQMTEDLKKYDKVFVICQSGSRSSRAVQFLRMHNINAIDVVGGLNAWSRAGMPMEK